MGPDRQPEASVRQLGSSTVQAHPTFDQLFSREDRAVSRRRIGDHRRRQPVPVAPRGDCSGVRDCRPHSVVSAGDDDDLRDALDRDSRFGQLAGKLLPAPAIEVDKGRGVAPGLPAVDERYVWKRFAVKRPVGRQPPVRGQAAPHDIGRSEGHDSGDVVAMNAGQEGGLRPERGPEDHDPIAVLP